MAYLGRHDIRESLRETAAMRAGQTTESDYIMWRRDVMRVL